jgi:hypothetical protein
MIAYAQQVRYLDSAVNVNKPIEAVNSAVVEAGYSNGNIVVNQAAKAPDISNFIFNESFNISELVQIFIAYSFIIAAALSAVFIFIGGVSFILSSGDAEKIKQAVNTIRYSIIGLLITIFSFFFVTIIGRIFGINFIDYLSPSKIKTYIDRVVQGNMTNETQNFEIK